MVRQRRRFGKRNVIKVDPLAYNVGLLGESGIGKTTLAVEYCRKLAGDDGYILLNIGKEDGVDAIPDAIYEDVPDWATFEEIVNDIIEYRDTDYKDLKVIVYDTIDELFRIAEPEVIRLHNREYPEKKVKSIKAAFGGYMAGEDKAIELILDKIWALKNVGISMLIIGHTKRKSQQDIATGEEYETLTANLSSRYFNAIKTKLHVLGVASIDRTIQKERIKRSIGKAQVVGKVTNESRIITFRDDNFNIDSKSRFTEIVPQIEFDTDQFIGAIEDAIKKAHAKQKGAKSLEETKKEQEQLKEEEIKQRLDDVRKNKIDVERNDELVEAIKAKFLDKNTTDEMKLNAKKVMDEYGITDFKYPDNLPTQGLEEIVKVLN